MHPSQPYTNRGGPPPRGPPGSQRPSFPPRSTQPTSGGRSGSQPRPGFRPTPNTAADSSKYGPVKSDGLLTNRKATSSPANVTSAADLSTPYSSSAGRGSSTSALPVPVPAMPTFSLSSSQAASATTSARTSTPSAYVPRPGSKFSLATDDTKPTSTNAVQSSALPLAPPVLSRSVSPGNPIIRIVSSSQATTTTSATTESTDHIIKPKETRPSSSTSHVKRLSTKPSHSSKTPSTQHTPIVPTPTSTPAAADPLASSKTFFELARSCNLISDNGNKSSTSTSNILKSISTDVFPQHTSQATEPAVKPRLSLSEYLKAPPKVYPTFAPDKGKDKDTEKGKDSTVTKDTAVSKGAWGQGLARRIKVDPVIDTTTTTSSAHISATITTAVNTSATDAIIQTVDTKPLTLSSSSSAQEGSVAVSTQPIAPVADTDSRDHPITSNIVTNLTVEAKSPATSTNKHTASTKVLDKSPAKSPKKKTESRYDDYDSDTSTGAPITTTTLDIAGDDDGDVSVQKKKRKRRTKATIAEDATAATPTDAGPPELLRQESSEEPAKKRLGPKPRKPKPENALEMSADEQPVLSRMPSSDTISVSGSTAGGTYTYRGIAGGSPVPGGGRGRGRGRWGSRHLTVSGSSASLSSSMAVEGHTLPPAGGRGVPRGQYKPPVNKRSGPIKLPLSKVSYLYYSSLYLTTLLTSPYHNYIRCSPPVGTWPPVPHVLPKPRPSWQHMLIVIIVLQVYRHQYQSMAVIILVQYLPLVGIWHNP